MSWLPQLVSFNHMSTKYVCSYQLTILYFPFFHKWLVHMGQVDSQLRLPVCILSAKQPKMVSQTRRALAGTDNL